MRVEKAGVVSSMIVVRGEERLRTTGSPVKVSPSPSDPDESGGCWIIININQRISITIRTLDTPLYSTPHQYVEGKIV